MSEEDPNNRKDRIIEVRVDFGRNVTLSGISAPGIEPMQFFGEDGQPVIPRRIEMGVGYRRNKTGLKVLQRAEADPTAIERSMNQALARFKTIIAVDTNSLTIHGTQVSVTAGAVVHVRVDNAGRWEAALIEQESFEFHDATAPPERVGW
jgi:hypothetical protein